MKNKLITLEEYKRLTARQQGYVAYMEAGLDGSELRAQQNPYAKGTKLHDNWDAGWARAAQEQRENP